MPLPLAAPVRGLRRLLRDRSGVALIELAYGLPLFLAMALPGAELAHFITTKMRISQAALHVADNAARMGSGARLAPKVITERDINDIFTGVNMQAGELNLFRNGRVILSSVEPLTNPNLTDRYRIAWQRCRGDKSHPSSYGTPHSTLLQPVTGVGPAGRQITAPNGNVTMFVEIYYEYQPLLGGDFVPSTTIVETAAMMVRDRRADVLPQVNELISAC